MRAKINLVTMSDIVRFVEVTTRHKNSNIVLTTEDGSFRVNGKSLIGALASMEWDNIYIVSDIDLYKDLNEFIVD